MCRTVFSSASVSNGPAEENKHNSDTETASFPHQRRNSYLAEAIIAQFHWPPVVAELQVGRRSGDGNFGRCRRCGLVVVGVAMSSRVSSRGRLDGCAPVRRWIVHSLKRMFQEKSLFLRKEGPEGGSSKNSSYYKSIFSLKVKTAATTRKVKKRRKNSLLFHFSQDERLDRFCWKSISIRHRVPRFFSLRFSSFLCSFC